MKNMHHAIEINATKEKVWEVLWGDETYRDWASIIDKGSHMEGELKVGNELNFIGNTDGGVTMGVTSKVEKLIPYQLVSLKQITDIKVSKDGSIEKRDKQWTGSLENYALTEDHGRIKLSITQDVPDELVKYFDEKFPLALERIKALAETK